MIVKNEEKNIEKALSWAKGFAFEQIVVDTGSTDRTVELAEKLGAKVYHFEWINDFSAAKNYAMDKATGDWIAILDADEYMPNEDVIELMEILDKVHSDPASAKQYDTIVNSWVQLNDDKDIIAVLTNQRIFRNSPELRYEGKIHEAIHIKNKYINAENLRIMHTGYALSTFNETDKRERNIKMLRDELVRNPENPDMMIYLADSIKAAGTEESRVEAEKLFLKALEYGTKANPEIKRLAYDFLLRRFFGNPGKKEDSLRLCNMAIKDLPDYIDYYYYRAALNNQKSNYEAAFEDLEICENAFADGDTLPETRILLPNPSPLFFQLKVAAKGLGDEQAIVKYTTMLSTMLIDSRDNLEIIGSFILTILLFGISDDDALEELSAVYNLSDPREMMFIARAAKDIGAIGFAREVMDLTKKLMDR